MFLRRLLAGGALLGFASLVSAASFSGSGLVNATPTGQRGLGGCGTTTLTHSTSQTITALNSVSCNTSGLHADNSYFRAFSLGSFPDGFDVCAIQFGVEEATAGSGGAQPVTVNIYASTGAAFPGGTRVLVGTANASVADQALTVLEVPVTAAVPAGAELVAEVFTPNGQAAGHSFFIGSNAGGESGPGYIAAAACGITAPATTSAIGFPDMHIVMNVLGTPAAAGNLTITPASIDFGTVLVGSTSAAQAVTLSNTGTGSLDVTALTAAAAPFARSGGTCSASVPFALAAGASCTLLYTYAPTSEAAANQVLTVTTPALGSGTFTLTGAGLVPSVPVPATSGLGLALAMLMIALTAFWTRRRA